MDNHCDIVDVSPRDGLQLECRILPVQRRLDLINQLQAAGLGAIEIGSFVNPLRVPQMADARDLCRSLDFTADIQFTALVPNRRGFDMAAEAGMKHVRLAVLASESLNQANFKRSVADSLHGFNEVAHLAKTAKTAFGVIIGAAFGCPYEGQVDPHRVLTIARGMAASGADEIMLADTTGMAFPNQVEDLCRQLIRSVGKRHPQCKLGVHLHNTRNTGYANAYAAFNAGIRRFDASLGGIGGCPFSPGAMGNIATEDLVHMFNGMGIHTGISLDALMRASRWLAGQLEKELPAMIGKAAPVYPAIS
jgi:(R)-citramalyl-CoA lyase